MNALRQSLFDGMSFLKFTLENTKSPSIRTEVLPDGCVVELRDTGVLCFKPKGLESADSILLSAGVHGNETAPIEIVDKLVDDILAGSIIVRVNLMIVLGNPVAINTGTRFVHENLNRLFRHAEPDLVTNYEQRRAAALVTHTCEFFYDASQGKHHFDLHTAIRGSLYEKFAVSPNIKDDFDANQEFAFLKQCGIESVLMTSKSSSTYSAYTAQHCHACSYTLELGKVRAFGENNLTDFCELIDCLTAKISAQPVTVSADTPVVFKITNEIIKLTDSFRLCFANDTQNFSQFAVGEVLVKDQNYEYRVRDVGERIIFPNADVAVGQRALVIINPVNSEVSTLS